MNATVATATARGVTLADPRLFRERCYVDGAWVEAGDRATIEVRNPATRTAVGTVPRLGAADTRRAIDAAARALPAWAARSEEHTSESSHT